MKFLLDIIVICGDYSGAQWSAHDRSNKVIINLMTATGSSLDAAGEIHGKVRWLDESDDAYRKRLIDETPASGGPAFPNEASHHALLKMGMSLRDYFAAKALQALISNEAAVGRHARAAVGEGVSGEAMISIGAYAFADAMLAERAK